MKIMAEEKKAEIRILEGSEHIVIVEEFAQDVVLVRLEHSGLLYRGALLNVTNRIAACGVNTSRLKPDCWTFSTSPEPNSGESKTVDGSAVVNRFSYRTEPVEPIIIQSNVPASGKVSKPGYKNKTVRNIRLRPRQVLCAKCKSSCSEKSDVPKPQSDRETRSSAKIALPPPSIPLKINLKKPNSAESTRTRQNKHVIQKTSPIIKISFNNPQGQGTVVKIPSKVQSANESDSEFDDQIKKSEQYGICGNKKVKKSIRKSRDKTQIDDVQSKHGKHRKHKHKHEKKLSQALNPVVALSPLQLDNYSNENDENLSETQVTDDPSVENPYRSPLRTKVIMKRERTASGTMNYVYKAHRISASQTSEPSLCSKNLTVSLCRVDEEQERMDDSDTETAPGNEENDGENIGSLMMRIQTKSVNKVMLEDQRTICSGDIVWGKIHGFPWWPGKVLGIQISQKDDGVIIHQQAHVSWFGSSTMSEIPCGELYPFLEDFELKFNKKKRGPYRIAIKQATIEAQGLIAISAPEKVEPPVVTEADCDVDVVGSDISTAVDPVQTSPVVTSSSTSTTPPQSPGRVTSESQNTHSPLVTAFGGYSSVTSSASPLMTSSLYSPNITPYGFSHLTPANAEKYSPTAGGFSHSPGFGHSPIRTPVYSPKYSPHVTSFGHSPAVTSSISPNFITPFGHSNVTSPVYSSNLTTPVHSLNVTSPAHSPDSPPRSPVVTSYSVYSPIVSPISSFGDSPVRSPNSGPASPVHSPSMTSPMQCF